MNKTWKPLLDRVICLQDWGPTHHPGTDVAIPEPLREKQRPNTGTVVAVGPGQWVNGTFCPVALQPGQHVMFAHPDTLTKVEHDGTEHLMMREQDVFLVLNTAEVEEKNKPQLAQICILEASKLADSDVAKASLDLNSKQFTHNPLKHDRFRTYNGVTMRLIQRVGDDIGLVAEQPHTADELVAALSYHKTMNMPIVFLGPAL